jgi:hypothetical protein
MGHANYGGELALEGCHLLTTRQGRACRLPLVFGKPWHCDRDHGAIASC